MMKNLLKEISLGFKTLRYGFQLKSNIALVVIFFGLGLVTEIFSGGEIFYGGLYMTICGIVPMQLICSLGVSDFAKTSPKRAHMETFIPSACATVTMLVSYTILVIIKGIFCYLNPENAAEISYQLIMCAGCCAMMLIYCGVVFKHFIISMILLIGTMTVLVSYTGIMRVIEQDAGESFIFGIQSNSTFPHFGVAIIAGYLLVLIGGFLCWLLSKLFYKHEMSKFAYGAALRKAMQ